MNRTPFTTAPLSAECLIASLKSGRCPACGCRKKPEQTFCAKDYYSLSAEQRRALYDLLGCGYQEAVEAAMGTLGASRFIMPEGWIPPQERING